MKTLDARHYLLSLSLRRDRVPSFAEYPYCLPVIRNLFTMEFHPNVTFIVGENGTGKSTLLEAIAVALGFNPEGGTRNFNFSTRASHSPLHGVLALSKGIRRPRDGFFLRAESFVQLFLHFHMRHHFPADLAEAAQAVGDLQEAVFVERRNVAGGVPAVAQDFGGLLRLAEVATHHVRATHEQQAAMEQRWREDAQRLGHPLP